MEINDLKNTWQEQNQRLDRILELNLLQIKLMQTEKASTRVRIFRKNQLRGIVAGIIWILFLGFLVLNTLSNIYFVISVSSIVLFNTYAVASYIKHLMLLGQIDIGENIIETQRKLSEVNISLNRVGRILFLQSPFYCTFWYNNDLVAHAGTLFWCIQLFIVSLFIFMSVYLYRNLALDKMQRKWLRGIAESFGARRIKEAMVFMDEIEHFEKET